MFEVLYVARADVIAIDLVLNGSRSLERLYMILCQYEASQTGRSEIVKHTSKIKGAARLLSIRQVLNT